MNRARSLIRLLLVGSLACLLAGCGETPVPPMAPESGGTSGSPATGPEILVVNDDSSVRYTTALPLDDGGGIIQPAPSDRALSVSADIDGAVGGRLRCGRFVLGVPPGAFDGKGTITMSMADTTVMVLDLAILPVELNQFKVPVKLCLVTDGTNVQADSLTIYWYDPNKRDWVAMPCDWDLTKYPEVTGTLTAEGMLTSLSHFSKYSGGKAGW